MAEHHAEIRIALGLCRRGCGESIFKHEKCVYHWLMEKLRVNELHVEWKYRLSGSAKVSLLERLVGRFQALRKGQIQPVSWEQAMEISVELRRDIGINWLGSEGVIRLARIIQLIDKAALGGEYNRALYSPRQSKRHT